MRLLDKWYFVLFYEANIHILYFKQVQISANGVINILIQTLKNYFSYPISTCLKQKLTKC